MCQLIQGKTLSAGQRATKNLKKVDGEKLAARNMHGECVEVNQVYEISREAKKKHLQSLGLGSNPLVNMAVAREAIVADDKKNRKNNKHHRSEGCFGIVRRNDWTNGMDLRLWNYKSLLILSELSKAGRLIVHMDGTKFGHLGLSNTRLGKRLLFTRITIQMSNAILLKKDKELIKRNMKGIVLAERIADRNRTQEMESYLVQLGRECKQHTGEELHFLMIHTDCAGQEKNGILAAFSGNDQVKNQMAYANVMSVVYLRLSSKQVQEIEEVGDWIESATWAWEKHQEYSKVAINECGSHIYRDMIKWTVSKDRNDDAKEVKKHAPQFETTMKVFAKRLIKEDNMSMAYSTLAHLVHIVRTAFIPCPDYDVNSEIETDYDDDQAEELAKIWANIIRSKAGECQLLNDEDMNKEIIVALSERQFLGRAIIEKIRHQMKGLRQSFALTYLSKKDVEKKSGEISVVVMHSPFADDGSTEPQMLCSFIVPIRLPFSRGKVKNIMRSKRTGNYLVNEWGKKLSLAVRTGPSVVGKANNMENPSTNQQAEGMISGEKVHVPEMRKHASDAGAYMWYRYNTLNESAMYMVTESEKIDGKLDNREAMKVRCKKRKQQISDKTEERGNKKQKRKSENNGAKTKDQIEMEKEDKADMEFDRNQTWIADNEKIKSDLIEAMALSQRNYVRMDNSGNETYNMSAMQMILQQHANEKMLDNEFRGKRTKFMSKPTFNVWLEGHYHKKIEKGNFDIVQSFVNQYEFNKQYW